MSGDEIALTELNLDDSTAIRVRDGKSVDGDKLGPFRDYLTNIQDRCIGLPVVEIGFEELSYKIPVPKAPKIAGLLSSYWDLIKSAFGLCCRLNADKLTTLHALDSCTGIIRPGTMTLILAPPGHGKSTLLKALANKLEEPQYKTGKVYYNGKTVEENFANGVYDQRLVGYVGQSDINMPLMTVRETFQFAYDNGFVPIEEGPDPLRIDKVELILKLIGLKECENTFVGNDLIRGISGGQQKRVSIGELLLGNARAFFLDEVTTGLDSAVAFDVMNAFRTWATVSKGTVVAALLQPTPETFALFDEVILLRLGKIVYKGPIGRHGVEIRKYFESQGIPIDDDMDLADFLQEFLTSPSHVYHRTVAEQKEKPEAPEGGPPLTTTQLKEAFVEYQRKNDLLPKFKGPGVELLSDYAIRQYGQAYSHSWYDHLRFNMSRQWLLTKRNKLHFVPRIAQSILMSLLMGTLFYQVGHDEYSSRVGLLMFAGLFVAFGNMAEIPCAIEAKSVVQRQYGYGFYPMSTYTASVVIMHTPLAFAEVVTFGSILYWIAGLAKDGPTFVVFLVLLFLENLAMSTWFRFLAYSAPTIESANLRSSAVTAIFLLFAGFLITYDQIPRWLIWVYWISPFSWSLRALAQNEFTSPEYKNSPCYRNETIVPGKTEGECALIYLGVQTETFYLWTSLAITIVYFFLFGYAGSFTLPMTHYIASGTKRIDPDAGKETDETERKTLMRVDTRDALPFQAVTLAFSKLKYTVQVPAPPDAKDSQGRRIKTLNRKLLRGITGFARPCELTALMGASGAGKTTLLDVLSGRTTSGVIEGEISVNGKTRVDPVMFSRLIGYVEQRDLHMGLVTVREALSFSAHLRLPGTVSVEQRRKFVNEILADMELSAFADTLVGDREQGIPGLSPGQLKRLTIGVELVANPSILFIDEPTSGLDSREALTVVEVIRRVARKGRTVVCTIHQPSKEVFLKFDKLILLQTGGHQVFFGEIGKKGERLVEYFHSIQEARCPRRANPASWILEILGEEYNETISTSTFGTRYSKSSLSDSNERETKSVSEDLDHEDNKYTIGPYPGYLTQFRWVFVRHLKSAWRNIGLNQKRINLLTVLGIFFGAVYYQIDYHTYSGLFSLLSNMMMTSAFCGVILAATGMPIVARERAVFYREQSMTMYSTFLYSLSLGLVELPFLLVCAFGFVTPFYFMVGLESDIAKFFTYLVAHFLLSVTIVFWSQVLCEFLPDLMIANMLQGVFFSISILFGGLFIPGSNIPVGWHWYYSVVNWVPKCFKVLALSQLKDNENLVTVPPGNPVPIGKFVVKFLDTSSSDSEIWNQIGYIIVTIAIMRILVALAAKYVRHIKR